MPSRQVSREHVEIDPKIAGGRPRIAGHRVRVQDVVVWHEALGLSPDEILAQCPGLSLADVYAALAYYHDHAAEIRRHIEEDDALAEAVRARTPSKLIERLGRGNGGAAPAAPG